MEIRSNPKRESAIECPVAQVISPARQRTVAGASGFRYAIRCGILNPPNPVREVVAPEGRSSEDTYAYSLAEILRMLGVLSEPARTICGVAAFTGLRRGELRGLKHEDYDGQLLIVRRSVWRQNVGAPKGKRGTGAVPVIEPLAGMLEQYPSGIRPEDFPVRVNVRRSCLN